MSLVVVGLLTSLAIISPSLPLASAAGEPALTTPNANVVITSKEPVELPLDVPATPGCDQGSIYVNNSLGRYDSETSSAGITQLESGKLGLYITPTANGQETFEIVTYACTAPVTITVTVDVEDWKQFTSRLNIVCKPTRPGTKGQCLLQVIDSGPGHKLAPSRDVTILTKSDGNGWKRLTKRTVPAMSDWTFSTQKLGDKPLWVKAESKGLRAVQGRVLLESSARLSGPGAAIVGDSFAVSVSLDRRFSGSCRIGKSEATVRSGVARMSLMGIQPGALRLLAVCDGPNWARVQASHQMWIRG